MPCNRQRRRAGATLLGRGGRAGPDAAPAHVGRAGLRGPSLNGQIPLDPNEGGQIALAPEPCPLCAQRRVMWRGQPELPNKQ
jgi:hypothetical protein